MSATDKIIQLLTAEASQQLSNCLPSSVVHEEEVAIHLLGILESILTSDSYNHEYETTLDYSTLDSEFDGCEADSDDFYQDPDYEEEDTKPKVFKNFTLSYMKQALEFYDAINPITGKRKHIWKNVKHHFQRIPYQYYMARFRKYVEEEKTKKQKVDSVDDFVDDKFERARDLLCPVHDIDLKRWSYQQARSMSFNEFTGSDTWLLNFKHKHDMCSRKITKVVTKREVKNEDDIQKSSDLFMAEVRKLLSHYDEDNVLNTDQSGLELEIHSSRTLSHRGERTTLSTVRSKNATTHSYTVQPMISLSGKVIGPVFLCLKEPGGRMSDNIKSSLFKADNVVVTCSASGKLTTSLVEYWRDNMFVPSITDSSRTLLLSDSWPGQGDAKGIYEKIRDCKRMEIPPKTTAKIQPLDVFFNHEYKVIARRVYDRVILDDIDIKIAQRNNINRLHSLIHNQISARIYKPIIRYAWFKSGYLHNHPGQFQTVTDVCFKLSQPHCDISSCDSFSFIRCSYCRKILCVNHFFIEYHMH